MFKGVIVALVTPFKNGIIDEEKLRELVEFHMEKGTDALVPCGTTGESATLSHEEHRRVIKIVVEAVNKRVPILAGAGSNCTAESISLVQYANEIGADGVLCVTPYYNKPTQEGLYYHYKAIAEVGFPVVLYNVPGRTGVNMMPETVAKLAHDFKNIVGIKEATGNLNQISHVIALCEDRITLVSGDDSTVLPTLAVGGKGVISVTANIVPQDMKKMIDAFNQGDMEEAKRLHYKLLPLCEAMFIETNPVPVKQALALMGIISPEVRLPLVQIKEANKEKLRNVLVEYGLIKK
ncbi:4-hydroxy-tetrahydrodipicolinate synthase [bacterium]|nr:4-hydroxy-tetrahydrodipicolinate synthase [bacterium]MBU1753494.1 4-hydroxy-tetrahydrodipicolinate synthase [bacterium]